MPAACALQPATRPDQTNYSVVLATPEGLVRCPKIYLTLNVEVVEGNGTTFALARSSLGVDARASSVKALKPMRTSPDGKPHACQGGERSALFRPDVRRW